MAVRKGIIMAGGSGTRLKPATLSVSKQLLPVYDKPLIYYPLSVLMQAQIREILIISTPQDTPRFQNLFGNGEHLGLSLSYCVQDYPKGLADAFIVGESFIDNKPCTLILGDNIFYGHNLPQLLIKSNAESLGATVFAYHVHDPERYGVVEFDKNKKAISIQEKPKNTSSNYAVTGMYYYDEQVCEIAKSIKPSYRGELEITDVNNIYLKQGLLNVEILGRGFAWLDAGTYDSLLEASHLISILDKRQGLKIACIEEIALNNGWINVDEVAKIANSFKESGYGDYLSKVVKEYL